MNGRSTVAFATNGDSHAGLGHLRRCVTLAHELEKLGLDVSFFVNEEPEAARFLRGNDIRTIDAQPDDRRFDTGYIRAISGAQVLVVDSYAADGRVFAQASPLRVVAVDDLADRELPVDLVTNGGAHADALCYRVAAHTRKLFGLDYALLRPEFAAAPARVVRDDVERVLVSVGGADRFRLSVRAIDWVRSATGATAIDVVIGPFFGAALIEELTERERDGHGAIRLYRDPPQMATLMTACDVAIAGGGQMTYELAATGTPAIAIRIAENQTGNLRVLASRSTLVWAGDAGDADLDERAAAALRALAASHARRLTMSAAGQTAVDGLGAARVAQAVAELCTA